MVIKEYSGIQEEKEQLMYIMDIDEKRMLGKEIQKSYFKVQQMNKILFYCFKTTMNYMQKQFAFACIYYKHTHTHRK